MRSSIKNFTRNPGPGYLAILLFPSFALGQITHRNLLQNNCPASCLQQVLISQGSFKPFPKTPAKWKTVLPDSIIQYLVNSGESALKENFPNVPASVTLDFVRNGNRTRYETISFGKRNRLWNLLLAESVEGKKRFLDAITDGIWSICEESFWGASAHLFIQKSGKGLPDVEKPVVDLFAAETAANLALADYFVGPQLDSISPLIRRRIYYEVNRRILIPLQTAKYDWMGNGDPKAKLNNWTPWIMSNYLTSVLLLEKDPVKRKQYVSKAMQLTDQYINGIADDGASEEGPHYWMFGAGCVFDVLNLLSSATNDHVNIYKEKIIRSMGTYIYHTHIAENYFVNVADSHPEEYPESIMVWRYGKAVADTDLRSFGSWLFRRDHYSKTINPTFHRVRALLDYMNFKNIVVDRQVFNENPGTWMPDVQMMTARLSGGFFIASHGGNNGESHNHNDVGDFSIYYDDEPVIIDVGSATYTAKTFSADRYKLWYNASAYHNLPTINGQQQSDGPAFAARNVVYKKNSEAIELGMDLEKAYPTVAGILTWRRTITATSENVLITDSFRTKFPVPITQSFMTVCDVDINLPGKIFFTTVGGKITLEYGNEWRVQKDVMALTTEDGQGLRTTWRNRPITRVLLAMRSPASSGQFRYVVAVSK